MVIITQFDQSSLYVILGVGHVCLGKGAGGGGWEFTKYPGPCSAHTKKWIQMDQGFVKMRGQKDLELMQKGVNWIENQGEK